MEFCSFKFERSAHGTQQKIQCRPGTDPQRNS